MCGRSLVLVPAHAQPGLRDQVAERHRRGQRVILPVYEGADFGMHELQRRVIADKVMQDLQEPAFAAGFGGQSRNAAAAPV